MSLIERIIKFPPLFSKAKQAAREKIVKRGLEIGVVMDGAMDNRSRADWEQRLARVRDPALCYPTYYKQPFHAYDEGNLSWEAALEVELAAKAVHATVMDPDNKHVDAEGDAKMRAAYHSVAGRLMDQLGARKVQHAADFGAAVGLSSVAVARAFPGAAVTGIDASPYFVAVGQKLLERRAGGTDASTITLTHALAEDCGLPDASVDLVSMCLVMHELPQSATRAIMREAHRILKPGGCMTIMEMDPGTAAWQRRLRNPVAFAAFKSTEPWLEEYIGLDVETSLLDAGFDAVLQANNTPFHMTAVARKATPL